MLQLFNSLSGRLESFEPIKQETTADKNQKQPIKMYVCGPTVYDDAHLGHARCYMTWDVLYRFLSFLEYRVHYVRNVTDVDDKILNRSHERNETPAQLAEYHYQRFQRDMLALNILPATEEPRATAYIQQILKGIQVLINQKSAYSTADGSVYFRVSSKPDYGKLKYGTRDFSILKRRLDELKEGARVETQEVGKESPLDFALWKAVPASDPNGWESPWPDQNNEDSVKNSKGLGWGRPGWHMECSAMNYALLGDQIDIHAGGSDLIFPHHENEIAQSESWTGKQPFAKYWLHNGFVTVSGEKMSKSLANFSSIHTLLERYDANTIRYFLLINHYRMPVDFNEQALQAAENWVKKLYRTLRYGCTLFNIHNEQDVMGNISQDLNHLEPFFQSHPLFQKFLESLNLDLNTPNALAVLNGVLGKINPTKDSLTIASPVTKGHENLEGHESSEGLISLKLSLMMLHILGFSFKPLFEAPSLPEASIQKLYQQFCASFQIESVDATDSSNDQKKSSITPLDQLTRLLEWRQKAKKEKNWAQADAIRQELTALGFQMLDHSGGHITLEHEGVEITRI